MYKVIVEMHVPACNPTGATQQALSLISDKVHFAEVKSVAYIDPNHTAARKARARAARSEHFKLIEKALACGLSGWNQSSPADNAPQVSFIMDYVRSFLNNPHNAG